MAKYRLSQFEDTIIRNLDEASIPTDEINRDYREYQAWIAAGNVPDPYVGPPPTPDAVRAAVFAADTTRTEWLTTLETATPDQIDAFVRGKVNADAVSNLATATACLKRIESGMVIIMKLLALSIRQ